MAARDQSWVDFWNEQRTFSERFLDGNARVFFERSRALLNLQPSDSVLELGSGTGHLCERIAPLVGSVCAVEGAPTALARAEERLRHLTNVRWVCADLVRDRLPAARAPDGYSVVVCHSVLQYLPSHDAVARLMDQLSSLVSTSARLLFADLPGQSKLLVDAASQLRHGVAGGFGSDVLWALPAACLSSYRRLRKRAGVLEFSPEILRALAERSGGRAEIIEGRLTANATRRHLFIER
ncbi:MAG TPA: class I SAM-dependent methyltransferase [Polyangiaceae bacterium]|nr:class I SAM-dependent methyltransferase [Polyangiaceae bacterium]